MSKPQAFDPSISDPGERGIQIGFGAESQDGVLASMAIGRSILIQRIGIPVVITDKKLVPVGAIGKRDLGSPCSIGLQSHRVGTTIPVIEASDQRDPAVWTKRRLRAVVEGEVPPAILIRCPCDRWRQRLPGLLAGAGDWSIGQPRILRGQQDGQGQDE